MSETSKVPLTEVKEVTEGSEAFKIFTDVKHDILHKIWQLHKADETHHLHEINKLDHIKLYKPILYRTQDLPYGTNYFGKLLMDKRGNCVHARAFKSTEGEIKFHALHWRPDDEGGAVFSKEDEITYFEY